MVGDARIEVVDDVVLHPQREVVPDPGPEHAGVAVAVEPVARMVRRPAQPVADVAQAEMPRQPEQEARLEGITRPA